MKQLNLEPSSRYGSADGRGRLITCSKSKSVNFLIYGRRMSVLESHEFENLREDMWADFVDADTRVRSLFDDPPPSRRRPTPAKRRAKRTRSRMNGSFPA